MTLRIRVKDSEKLIDLTLKNGLSINELARKTGLSNATICLLASGERAGCTSMTAKKIIDALKSHGIAVEFDDIFFIEKSCKCKKNKE